MENDNIIYQREFAEVMELQIFNDVSFNPEKSSNSCTCTTKTEADHVPDTNFNYCANEELAKDITVDVTNDFAIKKSDSMCNLLNLNDSQSFTSIDNDYMHSNLNNESCSSSTPKHVYATTKNIFRDHCRTGKPISDVEKIRKNKTNVCKSASLSDVNWCDFSNRITQISRYHLDQISDQSHSNTESLLSINDSCNKLHGKRCLSKNTLVNKFLQSIPNKCDNKTDNKPVTKFKGIKKCHSLYIKNVKVDRHLQDWMLIQISREISFFSNKDKVKPYQINSKLENFFYSQTLVYPNERIYKVCRVLNLNGSPALAVLTDYSIYLVGTGACCCIFTLLYSIWYDKLAAVIVSPSSQLIILVNKINKKLYAVNTAAIYGVAREFTMFLEIAIRRWSCLNSKDLFFSAAEVEHYYQMKCFQDLIPHDILPANENVILQTWVWLQEEYVDISPLGPQKESYIMFKCGTHFSWVPSYIRLKGGVLYVFEGVSDRVPKHTIELCSVYCKACRYSIQSDRPYSFEITKGNITFMFGAANEIERIEWVQILVSINSGLTGGYVDEKEVSVCGYFLLMTTLRLIIYEYPNKVCSQCFLDDIVSFKQTNKPRDLYCLLEFGCREALEQGGDWIVHFVSKETYDIFCFKLEEMKPNLFLETVSLIENESLMNRCRRVNFKLQSVWDPFFTNDSSFT